MARTFSRPFYSKTIFFVLHFVEPNIFLWKSTRFFTFSILVLFYDYGSIKPLFFFTFSILVLFYDYGFIKPMVFHFFDFSIVLRLRAYKTNVFFTFSILVLFYDYGFIKPTDFQ